MSQSAEQYKVMDKEVFDQAVVEHNEYLAHNPHKRVICDATITPFSRAMKSLGFVEALTSSKCATLRICVNDSCKSSNSTHYKKDGVEYWGCPHCKRISTN